MENQGFKVHVRRAIKRYATNKSFDDPADKSQH